MNLSKILKLTVIGAAVLGGTVTLPWAFCSSAIETYALFQCANRAYFEPVPGGFTKNDITGIFWQFGFGNMIVNTGLGNDGTAFTSKAFNGNDSGMFPVDLLDAAATFPAEGFPQGSVCLGSNNWANSGVDGCCDNTRPAAPFSYTNNYTPVGSPYTYPNDDNILNPYFGFFQNTQGYPGYYSLASIMDYPTAVLLRLPGDAFFAITAVTNMDRGNIGGGQHGPCAPLSPGPNEGACDVRQGFYAYANVVNGTENQTPATPPGTMNVIPWQTARPREVSGLDCNVVNCGGTTVPVRFQIDPIMVHSDEKVVPTNNPTLATRDATKARDATRAAGVGVRDIKRRWAGLVRYTLEKANIIPNVNPNCDPNNPNMGNVDPNGDICYNTLMWMDDPNTTDLNTPALDTNGNPTGPVMFPAAGTMTIPIPSCWRTRIDIGKAPEAGAPSATQCRNGRCGDLGIAIRQAARSGVTCFGNRNPLVSENIINGAVRTVKGRHTITWDTTAELTVQGFEIFAVTQRGPKLIGNVNCTECSSGAGASYETVVRPSDVRGGKITGFQVKMKGGSGAVAELPAR